MSIATWFVIAITAQYMVAGMAYIYIRDYGSATMFVAYAFANLGFLHTRGVF